MKIFGFGQSPAVVRAEPAPPPEPGAPAPLDHVQVQARPGPSAPPPSYPTPAAGLDPASSLALHLAPPEVTSPALEPQPAMLDGRPLRTWTRDAQGAHMVDFLRLPQWSPQSHAFYRVSAGSLKAELDQAHRRRTRTLSSSRVPMGDRVIPKDCTLQPDAFAMSYDADATSRTFVRQMSEIGKREGFSVVLRAAHGEAKAARQAVKDDGADNVHLVVLPGNGDVWAEDNGERSVGKTVTFPAFVGDADFISNAIMRDRLQRFYGINQDDVSGDVRSQYPLTDFDELGAVDERRNQEAMAAMALAGGQSLREEAGYIEGGNMLPGTLRDGRAYMLVGRDSRAVSKALMEDDLKRPVGEDELRTRLGADFGVPGKNVYWVEQPGTFHVDMAMGLLGPGQVIVNDAREVARVQAKWLHDDYLARQPGQLPADASFLRRWIHHYRENRWEKQFDREVAPTIQALQHAAERKAQWEDRAVADLQKAGLQVFRIPGVYPDPADPSKDVANFMNIRQGTNPRGERFVIALGGPPRAEALVADRLLEQIPAGLSRVWFLDRDATPATLELSGGIKCRTKGSGTIAAAGR
ncbi:MAG: hypothetical protein ACYCW6_26230 [Candidatus Xenobia bacterium]